jgi:hypothetical protein
VELVYTIASGSPDNAFPVFKECADEIAGQALRPCIVVDSVSMDTEDAVVIGPDPNSSSTPQFRK